MTMTQQNAAEALHVIEQAERKSIELRGYESAAPHLMLWGVLWGVGYTISYFAPAAANWVWLAIVAGGWCADYLIARHDRQEARDKRFIGVFMTLALFAVSSIIIMAPHSPNQVAAFIPLLVAGCYVAMGLFGLPRLFVTGVVVFLLTMVGFFAFPQIFALWMAAVGGGSMFLGGVWLRRA